MVALNFVMALVVAVAGIGLILIAPLETTAISYLMMLRKQVNRLEKL